MRRVLWLAVLDGTGSATVESILTPGAVDVRQEARRRARFAPDGVLVLDGDPRQSLNAKVVRRVRQKGERS